MSARQFVALGTQSQAPTKRRAHHAGLLRWDDTVILFDPGEGTQRQMAFAGITPNSITHICITHFHGDHCLGLAGMVQRLSLDNCPHPIRIYYPASGQRFYERLRNASIFADVATILPCPVDAPGVLLRTDDWTLSCLPLDHRVDTLGYRFQEKDDVSFDPARLAAAGVKGPLVGKLHVEGSVVVDGRTVMREDVSRRKPGQAFAFVMDTRPCDNALTLARDADLAVVESTFHSEHADEAHHYFHMTSAQAASLARESNVRRLALTHFSQRYEDITPLVEEARAIHADTVALDDLAVVDVPRRVKGGAP